MWQAGSRFTHLTDAVDARTPARATAASTIQNVSSAFLLPLQLCSTKSKPFFPSFLNSLFPLSLYVRRAEKKRREAGSRWVGKNQAEKPDLCRWLGHCRRRRPLLPPLPPPDQSLHRSHHPSPIGYSPPLPSPVKQPGGKVAPLHHHFLPVQ